MRESSPLTPPGVVEAVDGADIAPVVGYVLNNAVCIPGIKQTVGAQIRQPKKDISAAIASLQRVVAAKQFLHQEDSEWDAVAWTSTDSEELLQAVSDVAASLDPVLTLDSNVAAAKAVKAAAEDGTPWLEQLAGLAVAVKASWETLPKQQKQADHTPLLLVCDLGLMMVRLYAHAAACVAGPGATQRLTEDVLRQLCSRSVQLLLQESLAGHLLIFRWHEQPDAAPDLDAVMLRKLVTPATTEPCGGPCSNANDSCNSNSSSAPRLLSADYVPAAHRAWSSSFTLPLIPSPAHWRGAQEVLIGWNNSCYRAQQLGQPVHISPESFMLALEGLWLFAQPAGSYLQPAAARQQPAAEGAGKARSAAGDMQLQNLWPALIMRLTTHMEAAATAPEAAAAATSTTAPAGSAAPQPHLTADAIQSGVIAPGAPLLFGMLCEALQLLDDQWEQQPAAARAALVRATVAESDQPIMARQKTTAALLGKGKPKPSEIVCGELLLMVKQLALLLTEVLQLERSVCGGPQRDGTVPVTESGIEVVWFSCLWRTSPQGCCQGLEVLLRCPMPPCEATTTLLEVLLDDMWEVLKVLPLLDDRETAKAFTAAAVSSQKLIRLWQAATSAALLGSTGASAAAAGTVGATATKAAASAGASKGRTMKSSSNGVKGNGKAARGKAGAAAHGCVEACSDGSSALPPPAWLVAAAEADAQAALRTGLTLLHRVLDCAQKAYYWQWYTWWQQQQQQEEERDDIQAQAGVGLSASSGSCSGVWSSCSSFLSSSSDGVAGDEDDDIVINTTIEEASSSSSSSAAVMPAGVPIDALAADADQTAEAAGAAGARNDLQSGEGAVLLGLGYTALAAPCFQFVDAVIKRGFAALPEAQRLQQQEAILMLLEDISAGLAANSLMLVELNRLGLMPAFAPGAAAAADQVKGYLDGMLRNALTAADKTQCAAAACNKRERATAGAAAAMTPKRGGKLAPPEPAAPLEAYDEYWQGLGFEALDQLRLSKRLAGLAVQPVAVCAVGCHNPACCNLSGTSERRLVTLACRACRQVAYCCRSCQAAHWKAEGYGHRAECKDLQEAQQAEWLLACSEEAEGGFCRTL